MTYLDLNRLFQENKLVAGVAEELVHGKGLLRQCLVCHSLLNQVLVEFKVLDVVVEKNRAEEEDEGQDLSDQLEQGTLVQVLDVNRERSIETKKCYM